MQDQPYRLALAQVEQRLQELDAKCGGEDPRTLLSRALVRPSNRYEVDDYESAITRAAVCVLLATAIDQAETVRVDTGEAA